MELDAAKIIPATREFLAVVLAGFGNELFPLTSEHGDEPCPKALLPVGNKPMLHYGLSWLEKSGLADVLLICPSSHRSAISHYIHSDTSSSFASLRIDIQPYDESVDTSVGTCTLLRHFSSRISEDFVLLPCDFIPPPELSLITLLNKFRTDTVADGSIATACWFESQRPEKGATPDEWGPPPSSTSIVWDTATGTLLHIDTPDDIDRNADELELKMTLLSQYPRTRLSSNFQDSHVYVCKHSVLDVLLEKQHFDSLREEFFPWLCKIQYQRTKRSKYGQLLNSITNTYPQTMALRHSSLHSNLHERLSSNSSSDNERDPQISAPPSPTGSNEHVSGSLRVGIVVHKASAVSVARVNTLHSYLHMNRHFLLQTTYTLPTDPADRSLVDQKAQISADSMIGPSTKVGERASIKKSVIGSHCVIGKMTKIVGCVILDHCIIEDGAKLDGCILGKNTTVGAKAELTRCVTQAGYEVGAGETFKNEKLDVSDWTAARNDTEVASESGSDDDSEDNV